MNPRLVDPIAGGVLVLCWSSGFIGAVLGTDRADVDTVLAWRTLVSAAVLVVVVGVRRERVRAGAAARLAVVGLLVQVVYLGGIFGATAAGVSAGTCALIAALQPLVVAAVAGPLLGERTTACQRFGLLLGAAGVALVVAGDVGSGHAPWWAYVLPVLAVAGLASGTVLERRWQPAASVPMSLAVQTSTAAVVFVVVAGLHGTLAPPSTPGFAGAIAWLVVLSSFGGYGTYLFVARRSGATRASALLYLTPPTSALAAWSMFGQAPGPTAVPGLVVCAAGVALALRSGREPAVLPDEGLGDSARVGRGPCLGVLGEQVVPDRKA